MIDRLDRRFVCAAVILLTRHKVSSGEAIAVECEEETRRQKRCIRNRFQPAQQPAISGAQPD